MEWLDILFEVEEPLVLVLLIIGLLSLFLYTFLQLFWNKKLRKKYLKTLEKKGKLKLVLNDFEDGIDNLVYSLQNAYEKYSPYLYSIILNYFVIIIFLDIIRKIPEGFQKQIVSIALVIHLGLWLMWFTKKMIGKEEDVGNSLIQLFFSFMMIGFALVLVQVDIFIGIFLIITLFVYISIKIINGTQRYFSTKVKVKKKK